MPVDPTAARLADFLPYVLSVTSNAVSDRIAGEYRSRFGLRIPEWRIMAVLGDTGPATQRELASSTRMDKVAVNRACKTLAERHLVQRRANDRDGRSHHLELTAAGRDMHSAIMPLALDMEAQLFAPLTEAERKQFNTMLARVRERAGAIEPADKGDPE